MSENSTEFLLRLLGLAFSVASSYFLLKSIMKELDPQKDQKQQAQKARRQLESRLKSLRPDISFSLSEHESLICDNVVDPDDIDVTMHDIGALGEQKEALTDMVLLPLRRPETFSRSSLLSSMTKGILMYGPPGTGKTMLAKALAKESGAVFINVDTANILNKWWGESQKMVRAIFSLAQKLQPAIIFIDEIECLLGERRADSQDFVNNLKSQFLQEWDGFLTRQPNKVVVLAASNMPWTLDKAVLRRLPRQIFCDLPTERARVDILSTILENEQLDLDLDLDLVASKTEGYSGSDLKELCKSAMMGPARDSLKNESSSTLRGLKTADLLKALTTVKATGGQARSHYLLQLKAFRASVKDTR